MWSTNTNCKDCEEPHTDFADPGEGTEKSGPYTDEEGKNEDKDFLSLKFRAPQEGSVPSVRLWKDMKNEVNGQVLFTLLNQ